MPAIVLVTSLAARAQPPGTCRALAEAAAAPLHGERAPWTVHIDRDDVFLAALGRRSGQPEPAASWSNDELTVVLEGYIARDTSSPRAVQSDAEHVADLYRQDPAAIERLPGSFVLVVADQHAGAVMLWTDRAATRPCFAALVNDLLIVAPELKCFRELPGVDRTLVPGSLAAMAMNGALMDEHTYYQGVRLIGPARRYSVRRSGIRIERYWQRNFAGREGGQPPSAAEVADSVVQATRRHLAPFRRPVLALSGGLDSRLLLAAARRAELNVVSVTWGFDHVDTPGSDFQVARQLAEQAGIEHRLLRLDVDALPRHAERVVYLTDGLTGHLGNYTEGETTAQALAADFDAVVRGDEMFGDYPPVWSRQLALSQVGINTGKRLWLLRFLLKRDVASAVLRDYARQRRELLDSIHSSVSPTDVTDVVFSRTRFPRVIASQSPVFRTHLEVICPLLDNRVVDLLRFCTAQQREGKRYISACVRAEFPAEFAVPRSAVHSRTSWRQRFPQLGPAQRYLVETLLEPLASFDAWFDRTAIRAWLDDALAEGRRAPWPAGSSAWQRRRAQTGAWLLRPTFKERVVLNLVTLKLWFKLFA